MGLLLLDGWVAGLLYIPGFYRSPSWSYTNNGVGLFYMVDFDQSPLFSIVGRKNSICVVDKPTLKIEGNVFLSKGYYD